MVEVHHLDAVAVVKPEDGNERLLERTELERCLNYRTNPYVILGANISAPYVQLVNLCIMEIRPCAGVQNHFTTFHFLCRVEFGHWNHYPA